MKHVSRTVRAVVLAGMAALCLPAAIARSTGAEEPDPHPALRRLEVRLREVLLKECPQARIRYEERELVVEHRTRSFLVYGRSRSGAIAQKPHERTGPEYDGLYLRVSVARGAYAGAAAIPQDLREPYWTTYVNAYALPTDEHFWFRLSYGSRTTAGLIGKIREIAAGAAVPAEP